MWIQYLIAAVAALVIFRVGMAILRSFATPPPPPPEGDLRKVKRLYRCSSCGMEIRMQLAGSEEPDAPRHCMDEMDLIKREEDFL